MKAPILDVPEHFVEVAWKELDLVVHHRAARWRQLEICSEEERIGEIVLEASLIEEINVQSVVNLQPRPDALAQLANTKKKQVLLGQPGQSGKVHFSHVVVIFQRKLPITW